MTEQEDQEDETAVPLRIVEFHRAVQAIHQEFEDIAAFEDIADPVRWDRSEIAVAQHAYTVLDALSDIVADAARIAVEHRLKGRWL